MKNNAAGPEMLGVLRDDYKVRNGSENGYEEYLQKLKSSAHLQAMQEEIESNIVKLPIELFAMKDLDGNTVDLSRMKGFSCSIFGPHGVLLAKPLSPECKWLSTSMPMMRMWNSFL